MRPISRMLRLFRAAEGRDQRELATEIGISATTLGRIEAGKVCDLETWLKVEGWLLTDGNPVVDGDRSVEPAEGAVR